MDSQPDNADAWAARASRAVRAGSREALAEMYDRCADGVVATVRRVTRRDESFALDCMQEMFMRLAANPPVVDTHAALMAWMRLTALNVARNALLSESRRRRREDGVRRKEAIAAGEANGAVGVSAAERAHDACGHADDLEVDLESVLAGLDTEERALLRLRHVERMGIASIANAVGASPRAVESALRRLVARLREGGAR